MKLVASLPRFAIDTDGPPGIRSRAWTTHDLSPQIYTYLWIHGDDCLSTASASTIIVQEFVMLQEFVIIDFLPPAAT